MINDKPVPNVQTDARPHPGGKKGAKLSLEEVGKRAWAARMSPRLRAWATQVLDKAGVSRGTRRQKAKAILDAYRAKVPYIADPVMGEFIAHPDQTLCLDEGGLCIVGGDCDDAATTIAAALMSIGIPAKIVGSSHRSPADVPTHVYMAFEDDLGEWVRMDGTTRLPVGKSPPRLREWWIEPGKDAKAKGEGDFVGMSGTLEGPSSHHATIRLADLLYPTIR
jgi:transglutaminase-like putative cysteine protease